MSTTTITATLENGEKIRIAIVLSGDTVPETDITDHGTVKIRFDSPGFIAIVPLLNVVELS